MGLHLFAAVVASVILESRASIVRVLAQRPGAESEADRGSAEVRNVLAANQPDGLAAEGTNTAGEPTNWRPQIASSAIRWLDGPRTVRGTNTVLRAGRTYRFGVDRTDPDGGPIEVEWELRAEVAAKPGLPGVRDAEARPIRGAVLQAGKGDSEVRVRLPSRPGKYRLTAVARDATGRAATATLPILSVAPGSPGSLSPRSVRQSEARQTPIP